MKNALITWGGWHGHAPEATAHLFADALRSRGMGAEITNSLAALEDPDLAERFDLIIPIWTMSQITAEQMKGLGSALDRGVGLAGTHGGMGDAFRGQLEVEWMVGGHFVGHPHVGPYTVWKTGVRSPITEQLPSVFEYTSEQYYMLVDPMNTVLAETAYTHQGRTCVMPVVWTRSWGKGRVFYSALGHDLKEYEAHPAVLEMTLKGFLWAARSGGTSA